MKTTVKRPKKTHRLLQTALFSGMLLSGCFISTTYASPHPASPSIVGRYLDPTITTLTVKESDCFFAAPTHLMQVEPVLSDQGERVYKITHIADPVLQKQLYQQPLEEQIRHRQIVGRAFCHGNVAIADLDIPFRKNEATLDENDGLLLVNKTRQGLVDIDHILQSMRLLADQACQGVYSSQDLDKLDTAFQKHLQEITQITETAQFNGKPLLDGSNTSFQIPRENGDFIAIAMQNATTGSAGLSIASISLTSSSSACDASGYLWTARDTIRYSYLSMLDTDEKTLVDAINQDTDVTQVDVSNDLFAVTHQKSYPM